MIVEHPATGETRQVLGPLHRLWSLLFGFIYYAAKGMWGCSVVSLVTFNGLVIIFPIWNRAIIRNHYVMAGWRVYTDMLEYSKRQNSLTVARDTSE